MRTISIALRHCHRHIRSVITTHTRQQHTEHISTAVGVVMAAATMSQSIVPPPNITVPLSRRWLPMPAPSMPTIPSNHYSFTIMSYNILAQSLIRRSMFSYASSLALKMSHRRKQLTAEIDAVNADIICLQEVDVDWFKSYWNPHMTARGFAGEIMNENGKLHGIAVFYRQTLFHCIKYETIQYSLMAQDYKRDDETLNGEPLPSSVYNEFKMAANVAQVCVLAFKRPDGTVDTANGMIVSNTHLYWDPRYRFVRLRQALKLVETVNRITQEYLSFIPLLCGDYNISPNAIIYQYLTTKSIAENLKYKFYTPPHHGRSRGEVTTVSGEASKPADELYDAEDQLQFQTNEASMRRMTALSTLLNSAQSLPRLQSVYRHYTDIIPDDIRSSVESSLKQPYCAWTGEPPFTNYTAGWKGTLDYIFTFASSDEQRIASDRLFVSHLLELPTEDVCSEATAIPNEKLSSDHLAIAAYMHVPIRKSKI